MKNPVFYSTSHFKVVVFHLHLWDFFCFLVRFKRTFDFILYVNSSKIVFFSFENWIMFHAKVLNLVIRGY
jgi:hypothetical protein